MFHTLWQFLEITEKSSRSEANQHLITICEMFKYVFQGTHQCIADLQKISRRLNIWTRPNPAVWKGLWLAMSAGMSYSQWECKGRRRTGEELYNINKQDQLHSLFGHTTWRKLLVNFGRNTHTLLRSVWRKTNPCCSRIPIHSLTHILLFFFFGFPLVSCRHPFENKTVSCMISRHFPCHFSCVFSWQNVIQRPNRLIGDSDWWNIL